MSLITLNLVTSGSTFPIQVYVSDVYGNNSVLIDTITSGPIPPEVYITSVPEIFNNAPQVMVTLVDSNDCSIFHIVDCQVSPTPTPTNTATPTATIGVTSTPQPSVTPTPTSEPYYVYIFPEPQDTSSLNSLGSYMISEGAEYFFGFGNSGVPNETKYSEDLEIYAKYSGFTLAGGSKFKVPVSGITSTINNSSLSIIDEYGCIQEPYTFGTVKITNNEVDLNNQYFYSIWVPVNSIPIDWENMAINIGIGIQCSENLTSGGIPSSTLASKIVTVGNDSSIPSGDYRVLWMPFAGLLPPSLYQTDSIYFKGDAIFASLPTPTPSNSSGLVTPTPSVTNTPSSTPTLYYAYVVPEPQDISSLNSLGSYMSNQGAQYFYGYGNSGIPNINNYSNDLDIYIKYPGFINGGGDKFKVPVSDLKSLVKQTSNISLDDFGCNQEQYTFGTVKITDSDVDPNVQYFYSVWIPSNSFPISNNMAVILGLGSPCTSEVAGGVIPDLQLSSKIVNVTNGGSIPAGEYRVLWMPIAGLIPLSGSLQESIFIKGDSLV